MKKILLLTALLMVSFIHAQDYNSYLAEANTALEDGMYRKAFESAAKAIELNQTSTEAHWLRARASLTSNADNKALTGAIADLNFIIANNGGTARVYNALGVAESELGSNIFRFKRAKESTGMSDDNSTYVKEQTSHYNEAILHYENAKTAFKKSAEIKPETADDIKYKIQDADRYIIKIKEEITTLK